jgi:hypothetical protein
LEQICSESETSQKQRFSTISFLLSSSTHSFVTSSAVVNAIRSLEELEALIKRMEEKINEIQVFISFRNSIFLRSSNSSLSYSFLPKGIITSRERTLRSVISDQEIADIKSKLIGNDLAASVAASSSSSLSPSPSPSRSLSPTRVDDDVTVEEEVKLEEKKKETEIILEEMESVTREFEEEVSQLRTLQSEVFVR